ncbi:MAG: redoxin domain-containing protein [Planctomycetes bacterium]|nr:redoxin domain-containing protein [Planctomycetota bacterium]
MRINKSVLALIPLFMFQLAIWAQDDGGDVDRAARVKFDEIGMKFMGKPSSREEELRVLSNMIIALEDFVKEFPKSSRTAEAYKILSTLYYRVDKKNEALKTCEKIKELYPGTYEAFDAALNIAFSSTNYLDLPPALTELQYIENNFSGDFYERQIQDSKLQLAGICNELRNRTKDEALREELSMQIIKLYALAGEEEKGMEAIKEFQEECDILRESIDKIEKEFKFVMNLRNGEKPYPIDVTSLSGNKITLKQYEGGVVLLIFWASDNEENRKKILELAKVYEKYNSKGLEIAGISLDKDINALKEFIKKNGIKWPQYADGKGMENTVAIKYGVNSIPVSYLIDKNGIIRAKNAGPNELEKAIERLISE